MKESRWIGRRISDFAKFLGASRATGSGLMRGGVRFLDLAGRQGFSPGEIFVLGLLDGRLARDPDAAISNERLQVIQRKLNALGQESWTEDKLVFHERCLERGLPVPGLLAMVGDAPTRSAEQVRVTDIETLAREICAGRWPAVVLKPTHGVHGEGVLALEQRGSTVIAPDGQAYGCAELATHMRTSGYTSWIVQERMYPHRYVSSVSGSEALSTFRITTLVRSSGEVEVLYARVRLASRGASTDHCAHGASGNVVANISLESGTVDSTIRPRASGVGFDLTDEHPATAFRMAGWRVPLFREACALAQDAANGFRPLRTIGWDIGISTLGVKLIEGNVYWDAPIMPGSMSGIVARLRAAANET
jgi:hypothetical protein